ncbi:MAG: ATP-binding protein, partial [Anaerolineales bacterium]|nr:ATP-binding protein [Anaerolineales bacterium]
MTTKEAEPNEKEQQYTFKAEIKQVLDILVHSLYKERDIFLRELISNASDALTRLRFEMLTNHKVVDPEAELAIHLSVEKPEEGTEGDSWLVIRDSGIGLTATEMRQNLGTIAQSGAREFLQKMRDNNGQQESVGDVIGQFGVGFYSVFMVADEVRVVSRSYKPQANAAVWISDGGETYRIDTAVKEDRGTEIRIKLRTDAQEFADEWKLKEIIRKHSDFVGYPIYVGEDQVNQQQSLWRKQPTEVETEAYNSFYQQMTLDFDPPLSTIHFSSDAPLN